MRGAQHTSVLNIPSAAPPQLNIDDHALFLDLDGTLVAIEERPNDVRAGPQLRALLNGLSSDMSNALAIVTGRSLADLKDIIGDGVYHAAGIHGFEIQRGARVSRDQFEPTQLAAAREDIGRMLQQRDLPALIEDKHASLALHYRQIPDAEAAIQNIAREVASARGLRVLQGKMVVELIATARTKGYAVTVLMAAPPFSGRIPIAIGDDRTDEDAFLAAKRMGGFGVLVGERRASAADFMLPSTEAVIAWLNDGRQS